MKGSSFLRGSLFWKVSVIKVVSKGSLQKKKTQKYIGLSPILVGGDTPQQIYFVFFLKKTFIQGVPRELQKIS